MKCGCGLFVDVALPSLSMGSLFSLSASMAPAQNRESQLPKQGGGSGPQKATFLSCLSSSLLRLACGVPNAWGSGTRTGA